MLMPVRLFVFSRRHCRAPDTAARHVITDANAALRRYAFTVIFRDEFYMVETRLRRQAGYHAVDDAARDTPDYFRYLRLHAVTRRRCPCRRSSPGGDADGYAFIALQPPMLTPERGATRRR